MKTTASKKQAKKADFRTAYNKLAKELIKKALVDHEPSGREALIINERDVIEFEK